jgi:hypothetical protein
MKKAINWFFGSLSYGNSRNKPVTVVASGLPSKLSGTLGRQTVVNCWSRALMVNDCCRKISSSSTLLFWPGTVGARKRIAFALKKTLPYLQLTFCRRLGHVSGPEAQAAFCGQFLVPLIQKNARLNRSFLLFSFQIQY